MIKNIEKLLDSGHVRRWHQHPVMSKHAENLAEHQWKVAMFTLWLDPEVSRAELIDALTHDVGELGAGDLSPITKAQMQHEHAEIEARSRTEMVRNTVLDTSARELADKLAAWDFMTRHEPSLRWTDDWVVSVQYMQSVGYRICGDDRVLDLIKQRNDTLGARRL
jgi:5'-deoxynucleotidase YfbR-like HD superfamily hydrolase